MAFTTGVPANGAALASQPIRDNFADLNTRVTTLEGAPGGGGMSALTGDVTASGTGSVTATVARIQGRNVANTAPTTGQMLAWSGSQWQPTSPDGGGGGDGGPAKALMAPFSSAHSSTGGYPARPGGSADNGTLLIDSDTLSLMVWYDSLWVPVQV